VAEIRTALSPEELLRRLKATEEALGRKPGTTWRPRTIDLDLLLYGDRVVRKGGPVVPHPQMHLRSFVLDGLCELNPRLVHPVLKESVSELSQRLGGGDFLVHSDALPLVSIAGVIGVGKTTLAEKLAEALSGRVLFEPYNTNPFLPQVYAGRCELALDSQLYFLVKRAEQLASDALQRDATSVTDYVFDKELIYARRLLNAEQLDLYERVFPLLAAQVTTPVVVIYLQDSPQQCLRRIHQRNRPYEQRITLGFLDWLDQDYRRLFAGWKACPVIRIPASRLTGYAPAVVEHVALQVRAYLPAGVGSGENQFVVCP
jgi:deoxyguanosine kinase